jgi:hypothetical protein
MAIMEEVQQPETEPTGSELMKMVQTKAPEDAAAEMFQRFYPNIRTGVQHASKKDLVRYIDALVGYELEVDCPKFHDKSLLNSFYLAVQLLDCKNIMKQSILMDEVEAQIKKQTEASVETKEEKTNE